MSEKRPASFAMLYELAEKRKAEEREAQASKPPVAPADPLPQTEIKIADQRYPDIQTPDIQISKLDSQISNNKPVSGYPDSQTNQDPLDIQISRYPTEQSNLDIQISKPKGPSPSRVNRTATLIRLPNEKLATYKRWCFDNKVDLQDLAERAIDAYLGYPDSQPINKTGYPDIQIARYPKPNHDHDDNLIDDKLSSIRKAYREATGNKWTDKDTKAYQEVGHLDGRIIQAGIWLTAARAKTRIGSFRYCLGAVLETASTPITEIDGYLQTARRFVEKQRGQGK